MCPPSLPPELLHHIFSYIGSGSTFCSVLLVSRAFHSIAEPILYTELVFRIVGPKHASPFYQFSDHLHGHRVAFVKHLTIDIDSRDFHGSELTYPVDIESLLRKLTPNLLSFTLVDTTMGSELQLRLFDPYHSPFSTLTKLQMNGRWPYPYSESFFTLFFSLNGNSLEHLEILPHDQSVSIQPNLHLSQQALPSLRILGAYTLGTIFCTLDGVRNLTHLNLGSNHGMAYNVASDLQKYAKQLVNVTTFACSLQHPEVSQLARMIPNLERLDVRITTLHHIDFLMWDGLGMHVWPTDAPGSRLEGRGLKNLKMLRVTSPSKFYSDGFVAWAFTHFSTLLSLELPYLSHLDHHIANNDLNRRHLRSLNAFVQSGNSFYRFRNAVDIPSLVKWHCRETDEWFSDWTRDVEVVFESVEQSRYEGRVNIIRD